MIKIKSTDGTDTIIFVEKIQFVQQRKDVIVIGLDNRICIKSSAKFEDIETAIEKEIGKKL